MKVLKVSGFIILIVIILAITFAIGTFYGAYYILIPMGGDAEAIIDIPRGTSAGYVADQLTSKQLIKNGLLFRYLLRATGAGDKIKPGRYIIHSSSTMMEIIHQLQTGEGTIDLNLVTIPEGLTLIQTAELLDKNKVVSKEEFLNEAEAGGFIIGGKNLDSLEGYLYPETYDFPKSFEAKDIINKMLGEFERKIIPLYEQRKNDLPTKMTLDDIVILASMIERETQVSHERPIVASVYYNRLNIDMLLQCDATVQYALGEQKPILLYRDLEIDSPYNTYKYKGLPPGPIASPGFDSLQAALNPEDTDYFFYVRNDIKNDGSHIFTKTAAQHEQAIREYQK